jgi:hypothetical protein
MKLDDSGLQGGYCLLEAIHADKLMEEVWKNIQIALESYVLEEF